MASLILSPNRCKKATGIAATHHRCSSESTACPRFIMHQVNFLQGLHGNDIGLSRTAHCVEIDLRKVARISETSTCPEEGVRSH